jgi:hypothetical protein
VIRDPLYRKILERLGGDLDPKVFERCAADLLRSAWPTLVPVPGGSDSGVDGTAGLPNGPILISTTQAAVIANLRRSLKSYVKSGGKVRDALLATSRELNARRRTNLEQAAEKATFKLRQIYTREWFANRLYQNELWLKELLDLTGNPDALSLFPISARPLIGQTLIGRDEDLRWLLRTTGDVLVVGQPGSGKTFLMHIAARQGDGLFVVDHDLSRVAAEIREKSPRFLVVDDAHVHVELVQGLKRHREQTHATFRILANCWPGDQEKAQRALDVGAASIRQLDLLTRDEIVEVLKIAGISGPRGVVRELVNQADGRPGLAVTLCHLLLRGDVEPVANADALFADVHHTFGQLVGDQATTILAVFAIGGDWGMRHEVAADYLRMSRPDLLAAVTRLAAGGVLSDIGDRLSVRPPALRHALVRDTFFAGARSQPIEGLLAEVPNVNEAALTLIGARARGAPVPDELMHQLVESAGSSETWSAFVRLGQAEAKWTLTKYPDLLESVGDAALDVWPTGVLPLLLTAGVGDKRRLGQYPSHPLRIIGNWTDSGVPGTGHAMSRRQQLADAVLLWLNSGGDVDVALQATTSVLSPGFEDMAPSPGSVRSIVMTWGLLTATELKAVQALWLPLFQALSQRRPTSWSPLFDLIHNWLFPMRGPLDIPQNLRGIMTAFALRMAQDLAAAAADRPGTLHKLRKTLARTEHELQVPVDPDFEVLYPVREMGTDPQAEEAAQTEAARTLAARWLRDPPKAVAERLVTIEREAESADVTWPRLGPFVCDQIATATDRPLVWAEALRAAGARGELLSPFLRRLVDRGGDLERSLVKTCLDVPELRRAAVAAVLVTSPASPDLVELSLARLEGMADLVQFWCARGEVGEVLVERFLRHPDPTIAAAAAGGLWHRERSQAANRVGWREAMLATSDEPDYNLEDVFRALPDIAAEWLAARMREDSDVFWRRSHVVQTAASVLATDQRQKLLSAMPVEVWTHDLIALIIADDAELYRTLLQTDRLKGYHLSPLHGNLDEKWVKKARVAVEAGHSAEKIVGAVLGFSDAWRGSESTMWSDWVDHFEGLKQQSDEAMRTVGRIGSELASANKEKALARERAAAVHGYD